MVGHARGGTEHDLSDASQFQAEIDVFVDRAAVEKEIREAAGGHEGRAAHEAVAGTEPLDCARFARDGVVTEAQQWSNDAALPGVLLYLQDVAEVELPETCRSRPGLVVEICCDGYDVFVRHQQLGHASYTLGFEYDVVVEE